MARRTRNSGKFRSKALSALHEAASDLHRVGGIDKLTMRRFDLRCLVQVKPLSPREIRALRRKAGVSQGVFAHVLNVKAGLISQWERGERRPSGPSLKLLSLIKTRGLEALV